MSLKKNGIIAMFKRMMMMIVMMIVMTIGNIVNKVLVVKSCN